MTADTWPLADLEPFVAVHLLILHEAVCHACGWSSGPEDTQAEADAAADAHRCAR